MTPTPWCHHLRRQRRQKNENPPKCTNERKSVLQVIHCTNQCLNINFYHTCLTNIHIYHYYTHKYKIKSLFRGGVHKKHNYMKLHVLPHVIYAVRITFKEKIKKLDAASLNKRNCIMLKFCNTDQ